MRFSARTAWEAGSTAWAQAVASARASHGDLADLTVANPIACGLGPERATVLASLSDPEAMRYEPDPLGMRAAREAVVAYYADHGVEVAADRVCLTTSTSEAYSFLFRLLCDPGDEVLIARPSYPLFDLIARLDDVTLREFPLFYEPGVRSGGGWQIDFDTLAMAITERTRAVIVVHPNNPTGHYGTARECAALTELCAERGLALIVDEVFLDYGHAEPVGDRAAQATFAGGGGCLTFVLSGLSKICALPQMKASWIAASGPASALDEAMRRLEIVADTFLSMNAPVQHALGPWLAGRHAVQGAIRARLQENLAALDRRLEGSQGERLSCEGGWTVVLRVPRFVRDQPFALSALAQGVLVQPGALYGLPEGRCVLSLLTDPATWRKGLQRLPLEDHADG